MKKLLLASMGLFLSCSLMAQSSSYGKIFLTNHTITTTEYGASINYTKDEVYNGKLLRIIQLPGLVINQNYPGFRTLEYLPKNAFLVEIKVADIAQAENFFTQKGAKVLKVDPQWKLSHNLFYQDIPEWAWLNDRLIEVNFRHAEGIATKQVANLLKSEGYTILSGSTQKNIIKVASLPDQVVQLAAMPFAIHLLEKEDPGQKENFKARTSHRINYLQADFPGSVSYDGNGVTVGHGDDGALGVHIDFKGRLTQNAGTSRGDHGDHVAGTIFGAGNLDPAGEGMAPGANIYYQSYPQNLNTVDQNFSTQGVRVTASSYSNGCNAGYTNFTSQMDQDAIDNPELIHIFSAGNSGNSNCNYGAGSGWGNVTGGHKIAKNVIAVANMTGDDGLASSSSRGPASDGRIKPDVGAVGTSVYSTTDIPAPNSYDFKTGTSMSCPGVAGVMAVLYEAYRDNNSGNDPEHGAILKSILLNTADDMGRPGPDFYYGYGRVNARKALEAIENNQFIIDSISNTSSTNTHTISLPSSGTVREVRVMLYWPDAPASTVASRALVNDLDVSVTENGITYQPWVLDPTPTVTALSSPAVRGRDSLNNMEQVSIEDPSGNITVDVSALGLPAGNQKYFVTYEFIMDEIVVTHPAGGEGLRSGGNEYIRWDAPESNTGSFILEYSLDSGATWNNISTVNSGQRYFQWSLPSANTDDALVRVSRGANISTSQAPFTITGLPTNIRFPKSCPDSAMVTWDGVSGASGYIVYQLGNMYMDSIGFTTDTFYTYAQQNVVSEDWISVAATVNNGVGPRTVAETKPTGIYGCTLQEDIAITNITTPNASFGSGCYTVSDIPVTVELENTGIDNVSGFAISYRLNNNPAVSDSISAGLNTGGKVVYTFSDSLTLASGLNRLRVWINDTIDDNFYNDTAIVVIDVRNSVVQTLPYFEDFQGFSSCATTTNCGATKCNLRNGWENPSNGIIDEIDWRTTFGGTTSAQTGPNADADGNAGGKYLYLEASGGCDSAVAQLLTPCFFIDTTFSTNIYAEYAYHMLGIEMGTFSVDLITEDSIIENIVPKVSQGVNPNWQVQQIDLSPYGGQVISFRFRGKTGNGYRSDIAFDNFKIYDPSVTAPTADFSATANSFCLGDTVTYTDSSSGTVNSYTWDFGNNASPATAVGAGPHKVFYGQPGTKTVELTTANGGGSSSKTQNIDILSTPNAVFTYSIAGPTVNFNDASSNNPNGWQWDFGDGNTSNAQSPSHTYQASGKYYVQYTATNNCGSFTRADTVTIASGFSIAENSLTPSEVYPNPNTGNFKINLPAEASGVTLTITDLGGKLIAQRDLNGLNGEIEFNYTELKAGTYLLKLKDKDANAKYFRMIVY